MPTEFALSAHPSDCKLKDTRERALFKKLDIGKCFEKLSIRTVSVKIYINKNHIKPTRAFMCTSAEFMGLTVISCGKQITFLHRPTPNPTTTTKENNAVRDHPKYICFNF